MLGKGTVLVTGTGKSLNPAKEPVTHAREAAHVKWPANAEVLEQKREANNQVTEQTRRVGRGEVSSWGGGSSVTGTFVRLHSSSQQPGSESHPAVSLLLSTVLTRKRTVFNKNKLTSRALLNIQPSRSINSSIVLYYKDSRTTEHQPQPDTVPNTLFF